MIVQGAHAIRRGQAPDFSVRDGMRRDLFLIERPSPRAALEEIVSLVAERLPAHYEVDPVRDIQVFAPVYRGDLGIDALNRALRAALNPDGEPVRGGRLRLGDKLMMTGRNLHELGLMNGTVLRLLDEITRRRRRPGGAPPRRRRRRVPPAAGGGRQPGPRLRVLGPPRPGDRAAGRGHRRPPGRGRVLPAPRDALHRHHPRPAGHGHRRQPRCGRPGGAHAGHRAPARTGRRAPGRAPALSEASSPAAVGG